MIDQWRWKVFSGEIKPDELQQGLVGAAAEVSGHRAAGRRAAKPISILARSITSPPTCPIRATSWPTFCNSSSIARCAASPDSTARSTAARFYGNKEAGAKFNTMLEMGQSKPWPDALEALTGERADGRQRDAGLLRAAEEVAGRAEQGEKLGW